MKEINNSNNESIGFSVNDGSLDYLIKEKPVFVCGENLSNALSEKGAQSYMIDRNDKCFKIRFLKGYAGNATFFLREEVELRSCRTRFIVIKEDGSCDKGLLVENNKAINSTGINGLKQANAENFIAEFISGFSNCKNFASVNLEE